MKTLFKRFSAVFLAVIMIAALAACGQADTPAAVETDAPVESSESSSDDLTVNVMVLNGTTGFGMANLMYSAQNGEAALDYNFSVETDASSVTAALINGSADIAALPTNAAAALYNKTGGTVQVVALNTRGVLYLVADSSLEISSFEDLRGKTVYAPAQNPTFIFRYLCEANGLTPGEDIVIDNSYAQPADLNTAVSSGAVQLAVLPEPMVTIARSANDKLTAALDLTAEWDKVAPAGSLVQGCAVVRREFAEAHPAELACFLNEYKASVEALSADIQGSAEKIQETGIFAKAAVAAKAIPNCNIASSTAQICRARSPLSMRSCTPSLPIPSAAASPATISTASSDEAYPFKASQDAACCTVLARALAAALRSCRQRAAAPGSLGGRPTAL